MNSQLVASIISNGSIEVEWVASGNEQIDKNQQRLQQEFYKRFQKNIISALLFLGFSDESISLNPSLDFWRRFTKIFTKKLQQTPDLEIVRDQVVLELDADEMEDILSSSPFMDGVEYLDQALLQFLWSRMNGQLQKEIQEYSGTIAEFVQSYSPEVHLLGRVFFHLVENKESDEYPFAFLATYSSLSEGNSHQHLPLKFALEEYDNDSEILDLLATVELAAKKSELISDLLDSGEIFHPLGWKPDETFTFLQEVPLYEESGILCRIPDWWKSKSTFKVNLHVGNTAPQYLGMGSILEFDAQLLLGDEAISEEEIRNILTQSQGLAYIKGKWVEVNPDKLQQVLSAFEKAKDAIAEGDLSLKDAIQMQLGMKNLGIPLEEDMLEVSNGEWLESVFSKLQNPKDIRKSKPGRNFKAQLRSYQQEGLNWLSFLHSLQLGACLADDMGLGKTVQVIAFLNSLRGKKENTSLLVVPASLLPNWQKELDQFAPALKYFIAHPNFHPKINKMEKDEKFFHCHDLIITTYTLAQKYTWLKSHRWHYVVLDEAQAIKNPGTKQTKSIKKLECYNRIAMTGTPVENKLGDLWSLYDFVNPGLLGSAKEFTQFSSNLKDVGYGKLKQIIHPYILRRLKTDKSVIRDLPDKVEMKVYTSLSKKQVVLYKELVNNIEESLERVDGSQRRGLILGSLIKFKQICNHPDQYLGNKAFTEKDSGKLESLSEICETIFAKREKVLIFTQFREITSPLHDFLAKVFGREGLVLHGGISVKKRKSFIERFQSSEYVPFFILSVKAGGVGLNLTAANHVIHFDRWWNPAVENQATDRAFRIGQQKNVLVHKFVTKGTIEEKIDKMLEEKQALSQEIMQSTGENWMSKLDNREILDLFKLSL